MEMRCPFFVTLLLLIFDFHKLDIFPAGIDTVQALFIYFFQENTLINVRDHLGHKMLLNQSKYLMLSCMLSNF